jgi:hypothetical protein
MYKDTIHIWEVKMEANVVDLRYKMKDVLKALDKNESVKVLYHGKVKGIITPVVTDSKLKITDHPLFGIVSTTDQTDVFEKMDEQRGGLFNDL